jgi:hypothetical protein
MATDIKLDQQGGNWVVVDCQALKTTATDLLIDAPARRGNRPGSFRRALVHDQDDRLAINYGGDYTGGVTVAGKLVVTGEISVGGHAVGQSLSDLKATVAGLSVDNTSVSYRLATLERTVEGLVKLLGAAVIPNWRTKTEVEQGDDMGIVSPSAESLGLVVEYEIDQANPNFSHGEVISITPSAGTLVLRGSTVVVRINLMG